MTKHYCDICGIEKYDTDVDIKNGYYPCGIDHYLHTKNYFSSGRSHLVCSKCEDIINKEYFKLSKQLMDFIDKLYLDKHKS